MKKCAAPTSNSKPSTANEVATVKKIAPGWLTLMAVFLCASNAWATAYVASVTGNWNNSATWGNAGVPGAGDTVTIDTGITVTVSDMEAVTSIILNRTTGNTTELAINTGGTLTVSSTITQSGSAGTATVVLSGGSGTLNLSDVGTPIGSTVTLTPGTTSGSTVNYNGAGAQTMAGVSYDNITLAGSGAKGTAVTVYGTLTMTNTATCSTAPTYESGASVVYNYWNSGTLTTIGNEVVSSGNFPCPIMVTNGSSIEFGGNRTTIYNFNVATNSTLTLNHTITVNTPGILDISGTVNVINNGNGTVAGTGSCTVESGALMEIGAPSTKSTLVSISAMTVNGVVQLTTAGQEVPTATWNSGSELQLLAAGTLAGSTAQPFDKFTVNAVNVAGTVTLPSSSAPTVNTLTITTGTLADGGNAVTVKGNVSNAGAESGTGKIALTGGSAQHQLSGSGTYGNLQLNDANGASISSGTPSLSGTLTLTAGTFSNAGSLVVGSGGTIVVTAGALSGTPTFSGTVNLTYNNTAATTTGTELPTSASVLNNLIINDTAGVILNANATVNGTLTLTSGALNLNGQTLSIASGDSIIVTAGSLSGTPTFIGTVNLTYNNTASTTTGTELPASTSALNNLTNSDAAGVILNASATVNGTLRLTSGSFAIGANTLTLNGPAIAGTTTNLTTTASSTLVFGGSSVGTSIPGSVTALSGLTINNTNGVALKGSPTVGGTLTLTSGNITTGTNTLTVAATGTISGASSSSYVNGNLDLGLTTGSTSASFPVGDSLVYAPVSLAALTVTQGGDLIVSTVTNVNSQGAFSSSGLSQTEYVNRDWRITATNSYAQSAGNVTLNFASGDIQGGMSTTADVVGKYSSGTWTMPTVASRTGTSITVSGITSFSDWVVALIGAPPSPPDITSMSVNGTTLTITATNGAAGGQYVLLQSTDLGLPLSQWTPVLTNTFDGSGNLNLSTNIVNPGTPQAFYILSQ